MPLRALEPYEVRETGVGCAEHDDVDCLCDINIDAIQPVYGLPEGYESLDDLLDDAEAFLSDVEARGCETRVKRVVDEMKSSTREQRLYVALWSEGMLSREIAERLDMDPLDVIAVGLPKSPVSSHEKFLLLEDLAAQGTALEDVMKQTQLQRGQVVGHLNRLGMRLPASKRDQLIIRARVLMSEQDDLLAYPAIREAAVQLGCPEIVDAAYRKMLREQAARDASYS
jgi:DNA-binding CsgD family transcriptional regulator